MKLNVYSVHDAANGFVNPQLFPNDYAAQRSFAYALERDPGMSAYSNDFSLWYIGSFDSDTGYIQSDVQRRIMTASDIVPASKRLEVTKDE